jgi:2-hydroxychromene-2-carboxylate isomerase
VEAVIGMGRVVSVRNRVRSKLLSAWIRPDVRQRSREWQEARRKLAGRPHIVTAFLQLDDPYSYLLARYLPALADHYDIELHVHLSEALGGDYEPAPDLRAVYALSDCKRLAAELGLPFLDKEAAPPVEHRGALLDELATRAGDDGFADEFYDVLEIYWRGDAGAAARRAEEALPGAANPLIAESQQQLARMGHYNSAMLHYGGEWYWGVDRLHYLVARLDELGAVREEPGSTFLASIRQVMHVDLPVRPPAAAGDLPPIELFYSFRSPYSQICLPRIYALADAFGLEIIVRPVLPMVMRGEPMPLKKVRYIVRDAMREAETHGTPFGKAMDPVGKGVDRCHAVFAYAKSERRERDFLLNAAEMIWANAVDASTDEGMRKITAKTGLFWPEAKQAMSNDDWRETEAEDRQLMLSLGSWGVPTMCIGDFVVWGQDRVWMLARHIEELCDTGEGILI